MRSFARSATSHVCIVCAFRIGRQNVVGRQSVTPARFGHVKKRFQSTCLQRASAAGRLTSAAIPPSTTFESFNPLISPCKGRTNDHSRSITSSSRQSASVAEVESDQQPGDGTLELDEHQLRKISAVWRVKKRISTALNARLKGTAIQPSENELSFETILSSIPPKEIEDDEILIKALKKRFGNQSAEQVRGLLTKVAAHRKPAQRMVDSQETKSIMASLGVFDNDAAKVSPVSESKAEGNASIAPGSRRKKTLVQALTAVQEARSSAKQKASPKPVAVPQKRVAPKVSFEVLDPRDLHLSPLEVKPASLVPNLSFDLSRVLFNPGIYQLQDQRSRVFNFDPYLAQPMPVSEFNFGALNEYITSSRDERLLGLAVSHDKRYIGSSSSMSGALCQFHFLISQWRNINTVNVTRGFSEERTDFTVISKAPAAIFLRYRNGVYAVDADKEYDEPNVLMSLGKSLEKLLTLERDEFEKWRKTGTDADSQFSDSHPESYHYSEQGDFLLRSQLDARDSRLPGSGVFDVKTRAVAGIRMNVREHEVGRGYQIKDRYGNWESFEREYFDMMRSAFLKYSMQVRMGNMDGIFVAYHNIERLFGFQYIPISELDLILHGQSDPSLGDQEFRMSIELMNKIFNKVTSAFPQQPIRFHFETREGSKEEPRPFMRVFAEPMTEELIDEIQIKQDSEIAAFENRLMGEQTQLDEAQARSTPSASQTKSTSARTKRSSDSTDADPEVLDKVFQQIPADLQAPAPRPILAFKVKIINKVNNVPQLRPEQITAETAWTMDYSIEQIEENLARKEYNYCKNRRMVALRSGLRENHRFQQNLRELSESGASWRQEQDKIDAQRSPVVLYPA